MEPRFKRILIKLSGESLSNTGRGINVEAIQPIIQDIKTLIKNDVQVGIVIGGGNILRGAQGDFKGQIERSTADTMGMLATMINALALRDLMKFHNINTTALSARYVDAVMQTANAPLANELLDNGNVVIFAGGTGNPFVTTDTTAALRACEIKADALLKLTTVDGVYDKDPNQYKDAKRYEALSFSEVLDKELKVMDLGAFVQCRDFNVPICVFNMNKSGALIRVVAGEDEGTWIRN